MNRAELDKYINEAYGAVAEHLWESAPPLPYTGTRQAANGLQL